MKQEIDLPDLDPKVLLLHGIMKTACDGLGMMACDFVWEEFEKCAFAGFMTSN
jgi:hypothetical protein